MAFPEHKLIEFPNDGLGTATVGEIEYRVDQMSDKGFDFIKGAAAAYTAVLEGSVAGRNWSTIDSLAASGQGSVSDEYNWVKIKVTVGGALGTGNELFISGKVL